VVSKEPNFFTNFKTLFGTTKYESILIESELESATGKAEKVYCRNIGFFLSLGDLFCEKTKSVDPKKRVRLVIIR
jgi:hypothetical protein